MQHSVQHGRRAKKGPILDEGGENRIRREIEGETNRRPGERKPLGREQMRAGFEHAVWEPPPCAIKIAVRTEAMSPLERTPRPHEIGSQQMLKKKLWF